MLPTIYSPKDRWRVREMFGLSVVSEMAKPAQWPPLRPGKKSVYHVRRGLRRHLNAVFAATSLRFPADVPFGLSVSERAMVKQQFCKAPSDAVRLHRRKMRRCRARQSVRQHELSAWPS